MSRAATGGPLGDPHPFRAERGHWPAGQRRVRHEADRRADAARHHRDRAPVPIEEPRRDLAVADAARLCLHPRALDRGDDPLGRGIERALPDDHPPLPEIAAEVLIAADERADLTPQHGDLLGAVHPADAVALSRARVGRRGGGGGCFELVGRSSHGCHE